MNYIYRIKEDGPLLIADTGIQADWENNDVMFSTGMIDPSHILNRPKNIEINVVKLNVFEDLFSQDNSNPKTFYFRKDI
jgi:hypothetical protein